MEGCAYPGWHHSQEKADGEIDLCMKKYLQRMFASPHMRYKLE